MSDVNKNTISVVCPTFNSANYIEKTLASINAQTRKPDQLVIIDDGSSDNTIPIIKAYFKSCPADFEVTLERVIHQGPGAARNKGIKLSTSDWIAFLDSDDYWFPQKLERVHSEMETHGSCNFFCHDEIHVRLDGKTKVARYSNIDLKNELTEQLYIANKFSTSAIVCRKNLLKKVGGFDSSLSSAQDYELWLRMSKYMIVHMIPEILGRYIERPNNITNSRFKKRLINELTIAKRYSFLASRSMFMLKIVRIILSIILQFFRYQVGRMRIRENHTKS